MWIRTECGKLLNVKDVWVSKEYTRYETFDGLSYFEEIVVCIIQRNKVIKIKKQGDNLIDVLEDEDLLIMKNISGFTLFKEWNKNKDRLFYLENSLSSIKQVITHEQYLKLAQEVE